MIIAVRRLRVAAPGTRSTSGAISSRGRRACCAATAAPGRRSPCWPDSTGRRSQLRGPVSRSTSDSDVVARRAWRGRSRKPSSITNAEARDRAAELLDQPRPSPPPCRRWPARRRRSAPCSPGCTASRWISSRSVPYSSSYSSRSISHGSLPALRTGTNAGAEPVGDRRGEDEARGPRCRAPGRSGRPAKCVGDARRWSTRKASTSASSGVMSLNTTPGLREVGDVADERRRGRRRFTRHRRLPFFRGRGGMLVATGAPAGGRPRRLRRHRCRRSHRRRRRSASAPAAAGSTARRPPRRRRGASMPAADVAVARLALLQDREQRRGDEDRRVGAGRSGRRAARGRTPRAWSRRGCSEPTRAAT